MNKIKGKYIPPNKQTHSIRQTQLITTFGPGAIYDFPDQSLMTSDIATWNVYDDTFKIIKDERLQETLNVNHFKTINNNSKILNKEFRVPFVRFPEWYHCPKCGKYKNIKEWKSLCFSENPEKWSNRPICIDCSKHKYTQLLAPSSILVCCNQGHINDFPWVEWTHYDYERKISISCEHPDLKLIHTDDSGLSGLKVKCNTCGKVNNLIKVFDKEFFEDKRDVMFIDKDKNESFPFRCSGRHPHKGTYSKNGCRSKLYAIQRNALNLYNPILISSIVIPYDDTKKELLFNIKNSTDFSTFNYILGNPEMPIDLKEFKGQIISKLSNKFNKSENLISQCIDELLMDKYSPNVYSRDAYRRYEYDIILNNSKLNFDDFKTEKQDIREYGIPQIEDVVLIKKLKEIVALTGFTRLTYHNDSEFYSFNDSTGALNSEPNIVSLKDFRDNSYLANECYGEGIFIKFNEKLLNEWASNETILNRANLLNSRIDNGSGRGKKISPAFILLHSISHMLINELSFSSGYPVSALKERIYCNSSDSGNDMFGILIYTADSDSEGSLGGLVRQGKSDVLPKIIKAGLNRIEWCSSDPICRNSNGQGFNSLNLSACHSCLLLPETSCEERNTLLDRTMIIGTLDNASIGYFKK